MQDFSVVVDVLTLLAILSGIIFGVAEVRRARQDREDDAATRILFESSIISENIETILGIYNLPENASADLINQDDELAHAAQLISNQMETWGLLVFQRKIALHKLDLMVGGVVRKLWNRLEDFTYTQRKKFDDPNSGEWFQWLAERLDEYPAPLKMEGAYAAFRDWKP